MEGIINFEAFIFSCILLNLTPGSDTILTLTKSIAHGKNAGIVAALGIGSGIVVHTIFAALGLSVLISQSIFLFNVVKFAGAAYLIFMGVKMILAKSTIGLKDKSSNNTENLTGLFRDGFLSNILNPKVALFFIAFLPQFVNPAHSGGVIPFITLGLTFAATGTLYCTVLAIFAAQIFNNIRESKRFSSLLNKLCGSLLVGLGTWVAFVRK